MIVVRVGGGRVWHTTTLTPIEEQAVRAIGVAKLAGKDERTSCHFYTKQLIAEAKEIDGTNPMEVTCTTCRRLLGQKTCLVQYGEGNPPLGTKRIVLCGCTDGRVSQNIWNVTCPLSLEWLARYAADQLMVRSVNPRVSLDVVGDHLAGLLAKAGDPPNLRGDR